GAVVRATAGRSAAADQGGEALQRVTPLVGVEVRRREEARRARSSGNSALRDRLRLALAGSEPQRVLTEAPGALDLVSLLHDVAGRADLAAVRRIEGPVRDRDGAGIALPPLRQAGLLGIEPHREAGQVR